MRFSKTRGGSNPVIYLDSEEIYIRIGELLDYRRPSGMKREAGAKPARSRRCNRGRNLHKATILS